MTWISILWWVLLWTWYIYEESSLGENDKCSFNWYVFPNIEVIENTYWTNNIENTVFNTINRDWVWYIKSFKNSKTLVIYWYLLKDTCENLELAIDEMTQALSIRYWLFYFKRRSWEVVVNTASCSIDIAERYDTTFFIPYTVTVNLFDPFLYSDTLVEEYRDTLSPLSEYFTVSLWNERPEPFVLLNLNAWSSVSSLSIDINWEIISIDTSLTAWDTLLINSKNKEVMKSGLQNFKFTWDFQKLNFWTNQINVTYTWTLDATVYVLYYPTYA